MDNTLITNGLPLLINSMDIMNAYTILSWRSNGYCYDYAGGHVSRLGILIIHMLIKIVSLKMVGLRPEMWDSLPILANLNR